MRSIAQICFFALLPFVAALPAASFIQRLFGAPIDGDISRGLFTELEELSRIVDISYCVGLGATGVQKPFECLSWCDEFAEFELVKAWNTGMTLSDSAGYIALDHRKDSPRIILAFRGTYSIANTISDLTLIPQAYVPYHGEASNSTRNGSSFFNVLKPFQPQKRELQGLACVDCTVHAGFLRSWINTRDEILPELNDVLDANPDYQLTLVGHSLGGAVALLAGLELLARGRKPIVTTFGEPKVGNGPFVHHVNSQFLDHSTSQVSIAPSIRRVTHVDDPIPLLPPTEWGYQPHAGEIYISKSGIPPQRKHILFCNGNADPKCSAALDPTLLRDTDWTNEVYNTTESMANDWSIRKAGTGTQSLIPSRFKLWQLFFAHRDYFWRLGLCIKGGDPWNWKGLGEIENEEL